jgi:prepilin-type N-terminal cleavage/methylation domain-containing protein
MKKGFTLLEILLVIAAIGILAAIIIVAINPNRQLAQARNAERNSESNAILKALDQYLIDEGEYPSNILDLSSNRSIEICAQGVSEVDCSNDGLIYLGSLVPTYLAEIPSDPESSGMSSGYSLEFEYVSKKIGIEAQNAELDEVIVIGVNIEVNNYGIVSTNAGVDCKDILENNQDNLSSGTYWIHLNNPSNPFRTYCDMEYDGGGWTLTWSGREGVVERVEGEVLRDTSTRMTGEAFQILANLSTQIHIRTQDNLSEYVTSIPDTLPIQNLQNGYPVYRTSSEDSATHWTGTMLNSLNIVCTPSTLLLYHACGNQDGLHLFGSGTFTWDYNTPPSQQNIEVYLR